MRLGHGEEVVRPALQRSHGADKRRRFGASHIIREPLLERPGVAFDPLVFATVRQVAGFPARAVDRARVDGHVDVVVTSVFQPHTPFLPDRVGRSPCPDDQGVIDPSLNSGRSRPRINVVTDVNVYAQVDVY